MPLNGAKYNKLDPVHILFFTVFRKRGKYWQPCVCSEEKDRETVALRAAEASEPGKVPLNIHQQTRIGWNGHCWTN